MPQTSERWERVKEIFAAAMDLAPNERATLLKQQCGGDDSLRAEIESLLESDDKAASFIEQPAGEIPRDLFPGASDDSLTGQQFGAYQILREIGRGGLGTVYLAARSDDEYRKEVALKLVRRGLDTEDILRRFRNERQILAQLDHPNIARLVDGGTTTDGLPYFVMEYVKGEPVGAYCAAHALTVPQRLNLFRKVCAAVSYAHQNLVIHRDLKPSNILVAADGEPKLLDFGIAKLVSAGDELFTQTIPALRVMTPEYASPEQVKGAIITTASDIYSLGVLLYELLTGRRPYRLKTRNAEEIASAITDQEPERPSTAIARGDGNSNTQTPKPKLLRGDLDNIVLMALRKEPQRRYATVEQFSEDIRRHLEGRPVVAHKDTLTYRATKFVKRQKLAVTAALVILSTLIAAVILTSREQRRAQRRFNDVRQLSNALLFDIAPKIERIEGSTEARQAVVTQSLKYLNSLADESADDLNLQAELASAYEKVGILQGDSRKPSLGDFRGAIASLEKAQRIRRKFLEVNPDDAENRRLLAENLRLLAIRRMFQTDVEGGFRDAREAFHLYEKLVAQRPDALHLQRAFLEAQVENATNYINLSRFAEAIPLLKEAAGKIETLSGANAGDVETERLLGRCLASLGLALSWEVRQPEAEAEMTRAVSIAESLTARHPNDTNVKLDVWKTYESASSIYEEVDDAKAFALCEKSRRVMEEVIAADRANTQARHNLAKSFSRLGISASNLDKQEEALGYLEQAMRIIVELREKDPLNRGYDRDLSALYIRIGVVRAKLRDFAGALEAYLKSAVVYEKQIADDPANTIAMRDVAIAYRRAGGVHEEIAKTSDPETRKAQFAAAKEKYKLALNALSKAQTQKALPEVNRKLLEEVRQDVEELEKYGERREPAEKSN